MRWYLKRGSTNDGIVIHYSHYADLAIAVDLIMLLPLINHQYCTHQ